MDTNQTHPPPHLLPHAVVVSSEHFLRNERKVIIEHHGQYYVLRETSQGKLILTK